MVLIIWKLRTFCALMKKNSSFPKKIGFELLVDATKCLQHIEIPKFALYVRPKF